MEGFIYHVDLSFASSGGKRDCEGEYLMSVSFFFFLPQYIVCIFILFILAFSICLLCCVVLYQYLQADLHGKSSDTADKTSGKEELRINNDQDLSISLFSLF